MEVTVKLLPTFIAAGSLIPILFTTLLFAQTGNTITYTLNRASNPSQDQLDAYERIKSAMDSAIGYYNSYTTITKSFSVHYNTDVPTADANFNGTIRFGANRSYMVVGTAMHEIAHAVGVGTTAEYRNFIQNGIFTGPRATAMLREITGKPDTVLKGDSQHFWPYGLNYASEISSTDDLVNHCKIVNAMYQDMFREEFYGTCYLRSKVDGNCITVQNNTTLVLASCTDLASAVRMVALAGENTFRLEFGTRVLDIPNESTAAGVAAGLWSWNGGAHQRAVFQFQSEDKKTARIQMAHSGLYLRADGDKIIQDLAARSPESQIWELVSNLGPVRVSQRSTNNLISKNIYMQNRHIVVNNDDKSPALLSITDMQGSLKKAGVVHDRCVVSTDELARGIYFLQIRREGHTVTKKITILGENASWR